ncbi:MAG TPA: thiamine pyrophosphate-binding protein [Xanthobacteraceae bacterium]|jgi:thiamine pyrophosphate-dependent acetolactate synthase large subunit-like protein|nr:thiamine pyrophosphate-binding protein [Xanthobacteraceae bacterium]
MSDNSTVAAVIARDLAGYGARRCFGLLGTANFKVSHALVENGVELISARHECNAASMADAYAKATGELTLVSVHSGPGLTNALTGIGEAAKSRTPLVVLAGDVPTGAVKNNFYIEQAEMVRAVGAVSERLHTVKSAREDAQRAVTRALRDRQTVVLSMPLDVQNALLATNLPPLELPPAPGRLHPDPQAINDLAEAFAHARRPLILGGRGAVISDAESALIALADRTGALLATSVCGHGLFVQSPWSVGISGGFSSPAADELIAESDFILGFGASFTQWTTKKGKLIAPGAVVAQVDIEATKLGYQQAVQYAVQGDARTTAEALLAELDRRGVTAPRPGRRSDAMRARIRAGDNHHFPHPDESNAQFIDPRTLSKAVDALLPADRVVASDSGHFCGWVPRYLRVPNARASCLSHSFQSVGLGLPSAIGLAIANPGKLAVLGAGDGGFMMSMADFETAIRLKLRLCVLVYNDSSYAAEVHYFGRQGFSTDIVRFPDTDFAAIARGYGTRGATVRTLPDLEPVKAWIAEGAPGVFVIDGKINPNLEADWHAEHFPKDTH